MLPDHTHRGGDWEHFIKAMFLITDMFFFFHEDIELQRVRSDKNSPLWFSSRLLLKSRGNCSVKDSEKTTPHRNHQQKHHIFVRFELANSLFLYLVLLSFTLVASNSFSFPSLRSSYTAILSSTCFWIFLPSRIQSGEETDIGRQRLNHSSLSPSRFSELNKVLDTKEYNWWGVFITTNSVRLILGSQYSLCENYLKTSPSALRAQTSSRYQSDPPENQTWHTDEAGASLTCYQSTLISWTSFFRQWYFPSSGRSTNEILWEIVASTPFLGPSRLRCSLARSRETRFTRPNRRACSQARRDRPHILVSNRCETFENFLHIDIAPLRSTLSEILHSKNWTMTFIGIRGPWLCQYHEYT